MHRLLVSAAHKSSGKTTVSIGLAAALRARGLAVQTFKKGPDFIDPLWLTAATGRACRNLDLYLSPADEVRQAFETGCTGAEVALVEGNKGLYDGLSLDGSNSNAAVARLLGLPVVLVLDARGMTRGIAPLILGYQAFDRDIRIAGVILNRLGGTRHEAKLRAVIEHYTDVAVLGALQEDASLAIEERHLGLMPATEVVQARAHIDRLAAAIGSAVDLDRLLAACGTTDAAPLRAQPGSSDPDLRIGIARDRAFGFYYAEDLEGLERAGAQLVFFDALNDAHLPQVDALFIGGGFPEVLAAELSANRSLLAEIRAALEGGMPAYAECGGLMYLARSISWHNVTYPMVGAIAADVVMQPRPVGRGYVHLRETDASPWPGRLDATIRAHEFHHSRLVNLDPGLRFAYRVERGHGIDGAHDGIVCRNLLASYAHLRSVAGHDWPARFVSHARTVKTGAGTPAADRRVSAA
ncbi:MAG: cobyrinate a,c-diamide synthase [Gemmatimonadota bacterium]